MHVCYLASIWNVLNLVISQHIYKSLLTPEVSPLFVERPRPPAVQQNNQPASSAGFSEAAVCITTSAQSAGARWLMLTARTSTSGKKKKIQVFQARRETQQRSSRLGSELLNSRSAAASQATPSHRHIKNATTSIRCKFMYKKNDTARITLKAKDCWGH